jgi:hypothetical protein
MIMDIINLNIGDSNSVINVQTVMSYSKLPPLQKSLDKNPKKAASAKELVVSPLKDSGKTISSSDIRSMSPSERKKINPLYENN